MDFVSDEQRKAVMASLRERGQLRWRPTKSYSWSWPQSEYRWEQNHIEEIRKNFSVTIPKKQSSKLPKNKKVKCFYCHKLFDKEFSRDQHIKDVHPSNKIKNEREQNVKLPKTKKVKCFYCHKFFDKELARDQHIRDVHPNSKAENKHSLNFICSNCGKIFTNRKEFEEHVALSKLR